MIYIEKSKLNIADMWLIPGPLIVSNIKVAANIWYLPLTAIMVPVESALAVFPIQANASLKGQRKTKCDGSYQKVPYG